MAARAGAASARSDVRYEHGRKASMTKKRKLPAAAGWLIVPLLVIVAGAAWWAFDPAMRGARPEQPGAPAALPQDDFERRVREFILANPEVVIESVQRFERRRRAA